METSCDSRQVVGMDLHRRRSVLVRMTTDGRKLETARIGFVWLVGCQCLLWAGFTFPAWWCTLASAGGNVSRA